jgi:hypothetical protein
MRTSVATIRRDPDERAAGSAWDRYRRVKNLRVKKICA